MDMATITFNRTALVNIKKMFLTASLLVYRHVADFKKLLFLFNTFDIKVSAKG